MGVKCNISRSLSFQTTISCHHIFESVQARQLSYHQDIFSVSENKTWKFQGLLVLKLCSR
uniref:Uncharacterized protein n=1 Tax=Arundo donax TaxID=35708 RepID=A0A0A9EA26_ARUDO